MINDDDNWEPDEDFHVQLKDPDTGDNLKGKDTRTRVTIIDDDKPGQISFEEIKGHIKALAAEKNTTCEIVLIRKNGCDGLVEVGYKTFDLCNTSHSAQADVDYVPKEGTVSFKHGVSKASIEIEIIGKPNDEERDEQFGLKLTSIEPKGAKLSKKSQMTVSITTDAEGKKKQEALA